MKISNDAFVSLSYELRANSKDGEIVETTTNENPLTFIYGSGRLLPKFEDELTGLNSGDTFDFCLSAIDAYGEVNPNAIVDVPLKAFEVEGKIDDTLVKLGNSIPMMDSNGNRMTGLVKAILDESVTMDFNHPMAGQELYFKGVVNDVRLATAEELDEINGCGCGSGCSCGPDDDHGHNHGGDGCGCGDGCCS